MQAIQIFYHFNLENFYSIQQGKDMLRSNFELKSYKNLRLVLKYART